ncbi:hypothetical protein Ddye_009229 [Dipteronia dyeriana]|uniref:Leucine-rich repeat-containing N-terminal plant-type domain-containing protein n=1 Tax=Dipteronia dyeriana TaxID=168575 RepID=A0AAD9XBD3_9ROSI|nr:hypothetical protein Ddye_009229 [Dipteronia dyeriana]
MRIIMLWWLFLIPFLANLFCSHVVLVAGQCQSDQRSLLLQLRSNLNFTKNHSVHLVKWNQTKDCCNWSGVDCDAGGRVIGLDLSSESISGGIENSNGLLGLQYLQKLNLAFNGFGQIEIPSRLANLTDLTYLNLSNAGFVGQIPIAISRMTRLVTLDLSSQTFLGSILLKLETPNLKVLVQNLTVLRELYLDGVNISANGNEWCQALSSLLNLQVLSLSTCFLSGPIHPDLMKLRLLSEIRLDQNNLSSPVPDFFADFSNLKSLRFSSCGLNGTFPEKIFLVQTLETLDLSNNKLLRGSVPHILMNNSLRTLMLSDTNFSGNTLPDSIGNLKHLSRIELAGCNFTGTIPTSISDLTELVYLDLSANNFSGQILSFHMSKNLTYLDLSRNFLNGVISSTDWPQLVNLVYVDLRNNLLNGSIPPSLLSLPSLQQLQLGNNQFDGQILELPNASSSVLDILDLSGNRVVGSIPKSIFQLKNLKILLLSSNKFNGTIKLDSIQRLANLTTLDLSYNSLAVNANSSNSFLPRFTTLKLASCNLNKIPNLKNQSRLFHLDLSDNQISGEIPNWIWEIANWPNGSLTHLNLSSNFLVGLQEPFSILNLIVLDLHSNQLQGKIPLPPPTAVYVDYSNNNLSSSIPADIGNVLSTALFFSLSNNRLTGVIPWSICNATSLQVLDLSNNNLSGMVPTCLTERIQTLGVLNLRGNNLKGSIPGKFPGNCGLQTLDFNGNQLEGMVPKSLANCTMLEVLDLGNNQINDSFPCWLKNVSSLRVLVLRSNHFYGTIDCPEVNGSWPRLQIVDLASNNFSGNLPGECLTTWQAMMVDEDEAQSNFKHLRFEFLRLSQLYYQDAVTVTFKGLEMELVKILTIFTSIDLSNNHFQGPIPGEMGNFKSLYLLNLSHNALTGPIPSTIGDLRQLESLDLSMNNLSGVIPAQLAKLNFLSFLNLSYNHFVGKIPSSTQLQSFSPTSYEGNEGLCGSPLTKCTTNSSKFQPSASDSSNEFDWQFILMGIGFGIGSGLVVAPIMFSKRVNRCCDNHIDKILMVILPMVGFVYTNSHQRRIQEEEIPEDENTDEDEEEDYGFEPESEEFRGRYCVLCSKLDITRKKVIHDPNCTCHDSPPTSFSSTTSSTSSSLAVLR